jgi:hypothetical protein
MTCKSHKVSFFGKDIEVKSSRFRRTSDSPQEYVDKNVILCPSCGGMMFPGEKIWLVRPKDEAAFSKEGVLAIGEGGERVLVACLDFGCAPTIGVMCGELLENKQIAFFESPMEKAMRTNDIVIVNDAQKYRG